MRDRKNAARTVHPCILCAGYEETFLLRFSLREFWIFLVSQRSRGTAELIKKSTLA